MTKGSLYEILQIDTHYAIHLYCIRIHLLRSCFILFYFFATFLETISASCHLLWWQNCSCRVHQVGEHQEQTVVNRLQFQIYTSQKIVNGKFPIVNVNYKYCIIDIKQGTLRNQQWIWYSLEWTIQIRQYYYFFLIWYTH